MFHCEPNLLRQERRWWIPELWMNKPRIADCISEDLWSILEVVGFLGPFLHNVIFLTLTCFKPPVTFVDYKMVLDSQWRLMASSLQPLHMCWFSFYSWNVTMAERTVQRADTPEVNCTPYLIYSVEPIYSPLPHAPFLIDLTFPCGSETLYHLFGGHTR